VDDKGIVDNAGGTPEIIRNAGPPAAEAGTLTPDSKAEEATCAEMDAGSRPPPYPSGDGGDKTGWLEGQESSFTKGASRRHQTRKVLLSVGIFFLSMGSTAIVTAFVTTRALGPGQATSTTSETPVNSALSSSSSEASDGGSSFLTSVERGVVDINVGLNGSGSAAGTGIVLTSTGEVLTNNHVIEDATTIKAVDVGNGRTYTATVVGADKADDLAVLQLQGASRLQKVRTGDSSKVAVRDYVTAVGNAGGAGGIPSAAVGFVTALNQSITAQDEVTGASEQLSGLIQIDAAVQAGDSGGPLISANGDVIAIDTASATGFQFQYGTSEGFAIPIDKALLVAKQISTA
jgi:S1-C subfamily serine protease